ERVRELAARFFKPPRRPTGSISPPKPARPSLPKRLALRAARLAYATHFHAAARLGRFDLYHEPNLVPFRVPLLSVATVPALSVIHCPEWHPAERVKRYEQAFARGSPPRRTSSSIRTRCGPKRSESWGWPRSASPRSTAASPQVSALSQP